MLLCHASLWGLRFDKNKTGCECVGEDFRGSKFTCTGKRGPQTTASCGRANFHFHFHLHLHPHRRSLEVVAPGWRRKPVSPTPCGRHDSELPTLSPLASYFHPRLRKSGQLQQGARGAGFGSDNFTRTPQSGSDNFSLGPFFGAWLEAQARRGTASAGHCRSQRVRGSVKPVSAVQPGAVQEPLCWSSSGAMPKWMQMEMEISDHPQLAAV